MENNCKSNYLPKRAWLVVQHQSACRTAVSRHGDLGDEAIVRCGHDSLDSIEKGPSGCRRVGE